MNKPLEILESLGIQGAYEKSFKIARSSINPNRYVVGLETSKVSEARFHLICDQLSMPEACQIPFFGGLASANTVLIGFEQSTDSVPMYKLYLEYMDGYEEHLLKTPGTAEPYRLGIGFKWDANNNANQLVTHYDCIPNLNYHDIANRVQKYYSMTDQPAGLEPLLEIIGIASHRANGKPFLFLEISEPDSERCSFDINFYPANLKLGDVGKQVFSALQSFGASEEQFARIMTVNTERVFGHISAGTSRTNNEYFSVYYES